MCYYFFNSLGQPAATIESEDNDDDDESPPPDYFKIGKLKSIDVDTHTITLEAAPESIPTAVGQ